MVVGELVVVGETVVVGDWVVVEGACVEVDYYVWFANAVGADVVVSGAIVVEACEVSDAVVEGAIVVEACEVTAAVVEGAAVVVDRLDEEAEDELALVDGITIVVVGACVVVAYAEDAYELVAGDVVATEVSVGDAGLGLGISVAV